MEPSVDYNGRELEYSINLSRVDSSTSVSHGFDFYGFNGIHVEGRPSTIIQGSAFQSSLLPTTFSSSRNASISRRRNNNGRRLRSPFYSGLWISIELAVNVSQILTAIIVLSLSKNEHPQAPLFTWVIGYTFGRAATLPHLYWHYRCGNRLGFDQASAHSHQPSFQSNNESTSYSVVSFAQTMEGRGTHTTTAVSRLNALVDRFKMVSDCFFAIWFVVGNVWIFGGQSSAADSPNLYRLCIAFLAFSCIGYAMPFILCATMCCCFPCIIAILGFREDLTQARGATSELINSLPTCKFMSKRDHNPKLSKINTESHDGGILAAGTDKERLISSEDAVCCICLARYASNDELRELPCQHFFHTKCVDKWLKINALCPLCKHVIGNSTGLSSILSSIYQINNHMAWNSADAEENAV